MAVIKTVGLTKTYGKARGISNINLAVEEGEFYGFIGPNGAGKSTTIRTALGLIRPSSGEVYLFGKKNPSGRDLENVGYMASEAIFYNNMKVKEVIDYSAKLRKLSDRKYSQELCERLQLDVNKKINQLSLGNRKKVAIVCAMQHRPDLYIFDEPTSGLDPLMQRKFFDLLKEENHRGATIFLSSHILSEIQHNCNRAAIIRDGKVIAVDTMENLSKTKAKRVVLRGCDTIPDCVEAKSIERINGGISFLYQGEIKLLIHQLDSVELGDLTISEPELDEIFMHYYEGGEHTEHI